MLTSKEKVELIEIKEPIIIAGVSLQKSGLPITFESLGKVWGIYGDFYRGKNRIPNPQSPKLEYAVAINHLPDYIAGHAVSKVGELNEECSSAVLPSGIYIKDQFCAETFESLVSEVLPNRNVKNWAKKNHVKIVGTFSVEVYPWEAFEKGDFEMYTLTPVKG